MANQDMFTLTIPVKVGESYVDTTFNIKDKKAREMIEELGRVLYWLGVTSTAISDGSTTNPVVIPNYYEPVTPVGSENPSSEGWYEYDEEHDNYILTEDTEVVSGKQYYTNVITADVGAMVQYNGLEFIWNGMAWQAAGPNNLGLLAFKNSAQGTYTPAGSVAITKGNDTTANVNSVTNVGLLPSFTYADKALIFNAGTLPSTDSVSVVTASGTDTAAFTGTEATITVS